MRQWFTLIWEPTMADDGRVGSEGEWRMGRLRPEGLG